MSLTTRVSEAETFFEDRCLCACFSKRSQKATDTTHKKDRRKHFCLIFNSTWDFFFFGINYSLLSQNHLVSEVIYEHGHVISCQVIFLSSGINGKWRLFSNPNHSIIWLKTSNTIQIRYVRLPSSFYLAKMEYGGNIMLTNISIHLE